MKIRDFILSLVSWFILLVTVSCSDELGGERAPISSESNLHVLVPTVLSSRGTRADDASGLPTYNATVDECQINDLTLYAFPVPTGNGNDGKLLVETLPAPLATMMAEPNVANYQLNIEPGTYHIYVVANMNKVLSGQTIQTENELKKIVLNYEAGTVPGMPVSTNIPMIYEPKDVNGNIIDTKIEKSGNKYTEVAANLKFTCVKVKLNLIFDPNDPDVATNFGGQTFSINSISAEKLSPFTYLYWGGKFETPIWTKNEDKEAYKKGIPSTPYEASSGAAVYYTDWTDNRAQPATNNKDDIKGTGTATPNPNAADKWLFQQTYYLPERYISSVSDCSYLTINGQVGGSADNNYRINLGHKKDESSTTEVPVFPRGTFYEITGAIKTLGNMELDCKVSVKPWEMETISADFNHTTLWVSKTEASVTSTTTDFIDYKSNVMLTKADFGCDNKVGEKDVIVTKLDAVKQRITFNINENIKFSEYNNDNYMGTAKVWIKAGNIKKYLNVDYDASPYFEVNPQEVTIYWDSDNNTKVVQFKTNLGGLAFTDNGTSSTVGKSTIQASCDKPDTPEGTFKIEATSNPVTTTVHYLTVQPTESVAGFDFKKKIKVTVKPAMGNYRINFRAINDRAHYKGGNGTDNYEGTLEEEKEGTYNGTKGNTNWADGWFESAWDKNRIYTSQPDNHYVYVYTQIGETTGTQANSPVWKFTENWPGDKMNPDNTNVGWYYKDFSKDFKSKYTDHGATGEKTIKPGETLIMFSNNHNKDVGYTLHRCPHHLEPGIPLFDYEDREGWIVYDPTSDPTWNIYDEMPTIENINFTIYTKFQTYGWFNVYGVANGKNGDDNNKERESFTIYDTAGNSWSCVKLNNDWYKTVITLKAVKGDHEKAIRIKKDNGESVLLFNGNSYEKYNDTGYYDGTSWYADKPSGVD